MSQVRTAEMTFLPPKTSLQGLLKLYSGCLSGWYQSSSGKLHEQQMNHQAALQRPKLSGGNGGSGGIDLVVQFAFWEGLTCPV